jgi:flavin reductase (DIM6/NTAB) family NADH-FMN oxidoreductase RutF
MYSENTLPKVDSTALFKLGYGLYAVTCHDDHKDNALIVNTVMQITDTPLTVAVAINKNNYSHDVIRKSGMMNVNCLESTAPFAVFEAFGFRSGRDVNKFADCTPNRSANGLVVLPKHCNAFLSLLVKQYVDLGTHGVFFCTVTESAILSDKPTMTYADYHDHVKPKKKAAPAEGAKTSYVCKICGYVYEGEELPADYVCPLCKHGAEYFEKV